MKAVLVNPKADEQPPFASLKEFFASVPEITLVEEKDYLRIICPDHFVNPVVGVVQRRDYWATEIQEVKDTSNDSKC